MDEALSGHDIFFVVVQEKKVKVKSKIEVENKFEIGLHFINER